MKIPKLAVVAGAILFVTGIVTLAASTKVLDPGSALLLSVAAVVVALAMKNTGIPLSHR